MKKLHTLLILYLLSLCLPLQGEPLHLKFRHYQKEDGLPSNSVRTFLQDATGYIWIGTENGLCRFDGQRFTAPLGSDITVGVYALLEAGQQLWVGTDKGLYCCDLQTTSIQPYPLILPNGDRFSGEVTSLQLDADGALWISTMGHGVLCCPRGSTQAEQYLLPGGNALVANLLIDSNQQLWAISNWRPTCSLARFDLRHRCFEAFSLTDEMGKVQELSGLALHQTPDGRLWVGTWEEGLFSFDLRTRRLRSEITASDHHLNHIHTLMQYDAQRLLIGSDQGMTLYDTYSHQCQHFAVDELDVHSLRDQFVYPIMRDREGGLWVGSYYGGISYAHPRSSLFTSYQPSQFVNAVQGHVISHFCEDHAGHLWIASDDGGLTRYDLATQTFTPVRLAPEGEPQRNVHSLCLVGDELWIGTYTAGLYVLDVHTNALRHIPVLLDPYDNLLGTSCYALFLDRDHQLWAGTFDVITRYDPTTQRFERMHDLQAMTIDIDQDLDGHLWFCTTGNGIWRYDPSTDQWRCFIDASGLNARNVVNALTVDSRGEIWAASQDGLLHYDATHGLFSRIDLPALPCVEVKSLVSLRQQLWLGTSDGLLCYQPDHVPDSLHSFTCGDGLTSIDFLPNAAYQASDGRLFFGTSQGINAFYPHQVSINTLAPKVVFTGLEVYNQAVAVGSELLPTDLNRIAQLDLSHQQNVVALSFAALSFFLPEQNQYAYWLEGFDPDSAWVQVGNQHKAVYTHLAPGVYRLHVRAANNDGHWGPESSLRIVVHPPFYWNSTARLLYLFLFVGLLLGLYRYLLQRRDRAHAHHLQTLQAENERQLNESRFRFFTTIAHEIRTPVSLITAPLQQVMQQAEALPREVHHNLSIVERNSQRLLQLVNQLLDFRKYQEGSAYYHFRPTSLAPLLRGIIERFEPTLEGSHIALEAQLPPDDFCPSLDAESITKLVSNLLNNARKFTRSRILLTVEIPAEDHDHFILTVRDDGPGMEPSVRQRIFEPFYQAAENSANPGTGIGLSIVQRVVEHHQGTIRVESQTTEPSFSAFIVSLPTDLPTEAASGHDEPMSQPSPVPEPLSQTMAGDDVPTLLLVDDNEEMLHFLTESLRGAYQIRTATHGRQALQILAHETVSLVVSDWMMPVMDGVELCRAVRSNPLTSHLLFVLLTAKTDDASKVEGMNCGADAYIDKPFSLDYLQACLANLLNLRRMLVQKYQSQPLTPIEGLASTPIDTDFLSRLEQLIEQNFANPDLSVDYLCTELAISRSGFFAKVKTLADVSPTQMIQLVRLKHAARLLSEGGHTVTEVAYLVGFSSPSYFTKCFIKQFGVRPTEAMIRNTD